MKRLIYLFILSPFVLFSQVQIGQNIYGTQPNEELGYAITLNVDGTIMAIGSRYATNNNQLVGSVKVLEFIAGNWIQKGNILYGSDEGMSFGVSVALSDNGNILAVGTTRNDPNVTAQESVSVYTLNNNSWQQLGQTITNTENGSAFGIDIDLSANGYRLAIGAPSFNNSSGLVSVFDYNNSSWSQTGNSITINRSNSFLGRSVSLSSDGTFLGVGIPNDDSIFQNAGMVKIFEFETINNDWIQKGMDLTGSVQNELFGWDVALSDNGSSIAVGTPFNNDNAFRAGKIEVFNYTNQNWSQYGQTLKGTQSDEQFGVRLDISGNGDIIVATSRSQGGYASIFQNNGTIYTPIGTTIASNSLNSSITISGIGETIAIGSYEANHNDMQKLGRVQAFDINQLLSVNEVIELKTTIHPNPTASKVTVNVPEGADYKSTAIYDLLGNLLGTQTEKVINLSNLSTGTYFLKIRINETSLIKKIIVQ